MRTLQISNFILLVVVSFCLTIGCDKPVVTGPSVEDLPVEKQEQPKEIELEEPVIQELVLNAPVKENQIKATVGSTAEVTENKAADSIPQTQLVESAPEAVDSNSKDPTQGSNSVAANVSHEEPSANPQLALAQPSPGPSGQQVKVNHNDPTSYPVTKLAEKQAGQILMLSWNVESDGAEEETISQQLAELNTNDRYDVIVLSEVLPKNLGKFRLALGKHYKYAFSKTGWNDRLEILYNEDKFEKVRHFEVNEVNVSGRYRAPLVAHLKERKTEIEFLVMANHLARGKSEIRQKQANLLVEWAREQNLPVFALGDYNFDYEFSTDKGNPAFVNFLRDGIWRWVKPVELVDTNWFDNPDHPDGKDDYPGSMLDFAFVAGSAKDWETSCQIIVRKNDFPDDEKSSDHRPYELSTQK